jgi:PAS domain S-box-containing protein
MVDNRRMRDQGWSGLFKAAFTQSRNAMVLVDEDRLIVDVNGAFLHLLGYRRDDLVGKPLWTLPEGGPLMTPEQWTAQLAKVHFTGEVGLVRADDTVAPLQWGATTEVVTGRRLVLCVVMSTSRWGERFRRAVPSEEPQGELSEREREVVHQVALGNSGPEIADELGIAHDTVRTHVRNAMEKTGARSRAHLVAKALGEAHALR